MLLVYVFASICAGVSRVGRWITEEHLSGPIDPTPDIRNVYASTSKITAKNNANSAPQIIT